MVSSNFIYFIIIIEKLSFKEKIRKKNETK